MSLFERPSENYLTPDYIPDAISKDFASPLREIAILIQNGSKVLDIGCGNAMLARVLSVLKKEVSVDGVEPNPVAAAIAAKYCNNIFPGKINDAEINFSAYDWIVAADVLEHFENPELFLKGLVAKIHPHTKIAISLPNVGFGAVRIALLNGKFSYVDSGLLEKTHLRFFTRELAESLFKAVGLHIVEEIHLCRNFWSTEIQLADCATIPLIRDPLADVYQLLFILQTQPSAQKTRALGQRNSLRSQVADKFKNFKNLFAR